ncbi:MAG TPA: DUF924 family protein [Devosia sp.]|nr:DUF924 family protein [Devosia sp.]
MKSAEDILKFWFEEHGQQDWFGGKPEFDARLAAKFGDTHAAIARGEGWSWRATPGGRLAEIIVLDQFSRQLYRGRREAFANDGMALALAQEMVSGGHHNFVPPIRRTFVLMPFMHSESAAMQRESIRLFTALGNAEALKFAEQHAEVIARFGRFPRRNAALGRVSTPEEESYIVATQGMF